MKKTIAFLKKYEDADREAKALAAEYDREMELIDAVRSTAELDGLPRTNGISKKPEDKAIKLADKAAEFKIAQLEAIKERQEVGTVIFKVKDSDQRDVLIERYIGYNQTWEEICVKLHVSWGTVHNKHREGLQAVKEILKTQNLV